MKVSDLIEKLKEANPDHVLEISHMEGHGDPFYHEIDEMYDRDDVKSFIIWIKSGPWYEKKSYTLYEIENGLNHEGK